MAPSATWSAVKFFWFGSTFSGLGVGLFSAGTGLVWDLLVAGTDKQSRIAKKTVGVRVERNKKLVLLLKHNLFDFIMGKVAIERRGL